MLMKDLNIGKLYIINNQKQRTCMEYILEELLIFEGRPMNSHYPPPLRGPCDI